MLTDDQKDDVRRHLGFPTFGNGITASPPAFGYRYFEWYLTLEYRMNNLSTNQELLVQTPYLDNCNATFNAIQTASANLDTDRAAVWYHNEKEVRDRLDLYKLNCNLLAAFFGVPCIGNVVSPSMRLVV